MQKKLRHLGQKNIAKRKFPFLPQKNILIASLIVIPIHLILGKISFFLSFQNGISAIWPSGGLFLAACLLLGPRILPALLFADLVNSFISPQNEFLTSCVLGVCNIADPLATSFLINHFVKHRNLLARSQDIFRFFVLQIPTPIISSTLATTVLCQRGISPWSAYPEVWRIWFTSTIAGTLIVTPAILAWVQKPKQQQQRFSWQQIIEFGLLLLSLVVISKIAFWQKYSHFK